MSAFRQKATYSLLRTCFRPKSELTKTNVSTTASSLKNLPIIKFRNVYTSPALQKVVPFKLSDIGEGIREVVIKEWFVKVGDKVAQFDEICEVQSDKASVTITSRYDGTVSKLCHQVDDVAHVGETLLELDDGNDLITPAAAAKDTPTQQLKPDQTENVSTPIIEKSKIPDVVLAIPSVRRLAKEQEVNLKNVQASGKGGRVLKEDVLNYLQKQSSSKVNLEEPVRVEPIRGFTKAMVKTMTESLKIPKFLYSDEIVMTKLVKLRDEIKVEASKKGYKITYMPFFIKAASNALLKFPIMNSVLDEKCENIIYKSNHNMGVAIATPLGLVVPNIKDVQNKTILEITKDLMELQERGANGRLNKQDLTGGTFSLSNIGSMGGTYTMPIMLSPEVAIGGIGKTTLLPRFDAERNVIAEHITVVSWVADHRIIDGATIASFSNLFKHYLENPSHLLLNLTI